MVSLNLTILIELGLFLLFLWGTAFFIFRPTLRQLDAREEHIEQNENRTVVDNDVAEAQERRYIEEMSKRRRNADEAFRVERAKAMKNQAAILADKRRQAERAVLNVRQEAVKEAAAQRKQFGDLVPDLTAGIESHFASEERG